jgi:hypothetical protein
MSPNFLPTVQLPGISLAKTASAAGQRLQAREDEGIGYLDLMHERPSYE